MNDPFVWFWLLMVFLSIAWYAAFLFIVGVKGGHEIVRMTQALSGRAEDNDSSAARPAGSDYIQHKGE